MVNRYKQRDCQSPTDNFSLKKKQNESQVNKYSKKRTNKK